MNKITLGAFKMLKTEDIKKVLPSEITSDGVVIAKIVPKTWRDPRFVMNIER